VRVELRLPRVALEKITAQADNCLVPRNHYAKAFNILVNGGHGKTRACSKAAQNPMKEKIMVDARRIEAAKQAWASSIIEGFDPTQEDVDLWNKFVNEEISGDEYLRIVVKQARALERKNLGERDESNRRQRVA
jgi:hypothetical protein